MKLPENIKAIIDANVPPSMRDYYYRMVYKESSGNPNLGSSTGAKGLLQFTKGTGKTYGLVGPEGDRRADPVANVQAGVRLTEDNRKALAKALGRDPTHSELALAHQQGAVTAARMISGVGNASPRNLAVNRVDPNTPPQAAANKIMAYYGFDGRQPVPGMSLATNPYLPQLQHGPTAPSPFPAPVAAAPVAPTGGLWSKLGLTTPENEAALQTRVAAYSDKASPEGKATAGGLEGLDMIAKGLNPQVNPQAAAAAATITPMAPDANGAQNAMAAQQLMAALMQNRQRKYGLTLTDRMP